MSATAPASLAIELARLLVAVAILAIAGLSWEGHLSNQQALGQSQIERARSQLQSLQAQRSQLQRQLIWLETDPDYLQHRMRETALYHAPGESIIVMRP